MASKYSISFAAIPSFSDHVGFKFKKFNQMFLGLSLLQGLDTDSGDMGNQSIHLNASSIIISICIYTTCTIL